MFRAMQFCHNNLTPLKCFAKRTRPLLPSFALDIFSSILKYLNSMLGYLCLISLKFWNMDKCSSGPFQNGQIALRNLWTSEIGRPLDIWPVTADCHYANNSHLETFRFWPERPMYQQSLLPLAFVVPQILHVALRDVGRGLEVGRQSWVQIGPPHFLHLGEGGH